MEGSEKEKNMRGLSPWNSVTMDYLLTVLHNFHKTQEIIMDWYFKNVTRVEPFNENKEEKEIGKRINDDNINSINRNDDINSIGIGNEKNEEDAFVFSDTERRQLKKDLRTVMGTYEKAVRSTGLELLKRHGSRKMRSMLEENIYFKTRELYFGSEDEENLEEIWRDILKCENIKNMKEKAGKLYEFSKREIEDKKHKIITELGDMDNALQLLGRKRCKGKREKNENLNQKGEWEEVKEKEGEKGLEDLPEI